MTEPALNLIWIDLEMTGLDPENDRIIEIATLVTDPNLNLIAEGPIIAVHQSESMMNSMDDWNQKHHGRSGLIERVKIQKLPKALQKSRPSNFYKSILAQTPRRCVGTASARIVGSWPNTCRRLSVFSTIAT